jgi:hypothetical protein
VPPCRRESRSRDLAPLHAQPIAGLPHSYLMQPDYLMAHCRHKKSPGITRAFERAKGLEPSTFTLAKGKRAESPSESERDQGLTVTGSLRPSTPVPLRW